MKLHTHGGRRPGAGRPPVGDVPTVRRSISMLPDDWQHVEEVGDGNASAGVRALVEQDRAATARSSAGRSVRRTRERAD
jgi:hypothetical protein